ncbi:MAG TPA: ribonuclease P protein component [Rhodobacteraceae bacterium]|nr:ribonuclease P protein component [Paracoccaceae bacterium]
MPPGAAHEDRPPADSVCADPEVGTPRLETLRKRADFLACARARKAQAPAFVLQARRRDPAEAPAAGIRVGYTASKKVGNAVARNRAKRRLRALARAVIASQGRCGWDYVLIARRTETNTRAFAEMETDLSRALVRAHAPRTPS